MVLAASNIALDCIDAALMIAPVVLLDRASTLPSLRFSLSMSACSAFLTACWCVVTARGSPAASFAVKSPMLPFQSFTTSPVTSWPPRSETFILGAPW